MPPPFRPVGARVEVARGEDWSFMVYRTADGFGVTYSRSSGASSNTIGKPPPDESSASTYIVALLVSCLASDGLVLERRVLHPRAGSG
jgi:hypothetical protein